MVKKRDLSHRATFEEQGETWVRHLLHSTDDRDNKSQASAWLEERRIEREEAASSKRDAREEETFLSPKKLTQLLVHKLLLLVVLLGMPCMPL